jgi:D-alanine-D-alanine ligase and related ATP-grasp enzymes
VNDLREMRVNERMGVLGRVAASVRAELSVLKQDRMTRIGFAYNQKPEVPALRLEDGAEDARPDEEPPSNSPSDWSSAADDKSARAAGIAAADVDDEFAEWDSAETINAVEQALGALGEVIRLEANSDFPERLRATQPDIVYNIAEGMGGVNREAHVPAICEFFGIPYSGSDPFSLSLCLDKARTKEFLAYHGVPTAPFALIRNAAEIPAMLDRLTTRKTKTGSTRLRLPLFVKPVHEGSSKGITEDNYCRTVAEAQEQTAFLLERYAQPVLVEEYLPGREFTCAVMGNGEGAHVLPIVGMNFEALPPGALRCTASKPSGSGTNGATRWRFLSALRGSMRRCGAGSKRSCSPPTRFLAAAIGRESMCDWMPLACRTWWK